jgi:predicted GIY-YIG superfamily endonuclease
MYDDGGQLLYVGITSSPDHRFTQHASDKVWWPEVRGITLEWYDDRESVEKAEKRAIRTENPRHNVVHRDKKRAPRPAPVQPARTGPAVRPSLETAYGVRVHVGDVVRHDKQGVGRVIDFQVTQDGDDVICIQFVIGEPKRFLARYATITESLPWLGDLTEAEPGGALRWSEAQ